MTGGRVAFDSLIRDRLAPFFRAYGFRKQRQTFGLRGDGTWGVVNFQKSSWDIDGTVAFYVNVAVGSNRLMPERAGATRLPAESSCAIRLRLRDLVGLDCPGWWSLLSSADVDSVAAELEVGLAQMAIPFLRTLNSDAAILGYWHDLLERGDWHSGRMPLPAVVRLAAAVGDEELADRARLSLSAAQAGR